SRPLSPRRHARFWRGGEASRRSRLGVQSHPLLGSEQAGPLPEWGNRIDLQSLGYLADHCIQGQPVFPMTAYLEMGLAAACRVLKPGRYALEEAQLRSALLLEGQGAMVQSVYHPGSNTLEVFSRARSGVPWTAHASMLLRSRSDGLSPGPGRSLAKARERCRAELGKEECYRLFARLGLNY